MRINKILKDDRISEVIRKIIGHFSDIADIITCVVIGVFVYTIMVMIATGKLCGISPYIMLWMFALMYKFSFYYVVNFFFNSAPFWIYFNNTILKKFSLTTLFGVEFISSPKKLVEYTRTNPFKIIINEINCYILMTICIFWFYKHNLHFDIFIFSAILSLLGGKFYVFNDWYVHNKMKLSPAKSFMFTVNNYLMNSTSYNLIYFAIGLMIGLLNYCIQKSNLRKSKKTTLKSLENGIRL